MAKKEQTAFLLMKDQKEIVDELSNEEAGIIFKAIYEYETTKKIPTLDKTLRIVFKQFKVKLDAYEEAYELKCLKNKENVEKRWNKNQDANEYDGIRTNTNCTNKIKRNKIKRKEIKRSENINKENEPVAHATATTPSPFNLNSVLSYGEAKGANEEYCNKFYQYYINKEWNEKQWKAKFDEWCKKDKIEPSLYELKDLGGGAFQIC